jgi:protein-S-isoprenylcysteine O-methyltransferase Ste14
MEVALPLQEELVRSGAWLFRWRSYLPLVALALVLLQVPGFTYLGGGYDRAWELLSLAVGLLGLAIRAHVIGHVPHGTSGRNTHAQIADALNTTGWYSVVRHPLYLGNFLMWLAPVLFVRHAWLVAVVVLAFWLYYERIMLVEEDWLRSRFGQDFVQWAERTPAIVPRFRNWRSASLPFSLRNVLRREYSGLLGLVGTLTALKVATDGAVLRRLHVDPLWAGLFGASVALYLVLRFLKRRTNVLAVPGR